MRPSWTIEGKTGWVLMLAVLVAGLTTGPAFAAPKRGGVYRSSMATDLTNLDVHKTQAQIDNAVLGMTVYEPLSPTTRNST